MEKQISIYKLIAYSLEFEGSLSIGKHKQKNENYQYNIQIYIGNTKKELLEDFRDDIGFGKISNGIIRSEYRAKMYYWAMNTKEIKQHLPLILPYLIIKWQQAKLILELSNILKTIDYQCKLNNQTRLEMYTYDEKLTMELNWRACKELNEDWNIRNRHSKNDLFLMNMRNK